MSIFNEFPYTNFHELNLDWILKTVKDLVNEWLSYHENWDKWREDTDAAMQALKDYVNDYFNNLDIQAEVGEKLDEMIESGTLADIINHEVLENVKGRLDNIYPDTETHEKYMEMVRKNLVSYLIRNNFSSCMEGSPNPDTFKTIFKYQVGSTYMGLYGAGTFDYNSIQNIDGTDYHIAYLDCVTFTSLITRGRPFESSPYFKAFNDYPDATIEDLFPLGLEDPNPEANYTFDWLNNLKPDNAARIMNNSGNTLRLLKTLPNDTLNTAALNNLETGDIIYIGSRSHTPTNYKYIYHCGVFVKTLEELNELVTNYNVTFRPADNETVENGFIVNVWNQGTVDYKDKLIIQTLNYWLNNIVLGSDQTVYMSKGFANSQNSNKQYSLVSGLYRLYDELRPVDTVTYSALTFPTSEGRLIINNNIDSYVGGQPIPLDNINIDDMNTPKYNGIWKPYSSAALGRITGNIPRTNVFFDLIVISGGANGRGAKQIFITSSQTMNARNLIYIRQTGASSNVFGPWVPVLVNMRVGTITARTVPANSHVAVPVTFDSELPFAGWVQITPFITGESAQYGSTTVAISGNSATGFTAHLYNNTDYDAAIGAFWLAY